MKEFYSKISQSWASKQSLLCIGLDPDPSRFPEHISKSENGIYEFCTQIVEATADWACAFKPQIAYFAAHAAEGALQQIILDIKNNHPDTPVILDAKRGDIGSTAQMYAREAFERYAADAVTVNPYMGGETLKPFTDYADKGVIVLCRTSNPGSGDFQNQQLGGEHTLAEQVAKKASQSWNENQNIGLVVGATYPEELNNIRKIVGEMPLLVPGIGAQGGDLQQVINNGLTESGGGLMINVSRSVLYAGGGLEFAQHSASEAQKLCNEITLALKSR